MKLHSRICSLLAPLALGMALANPASAVVITSTVGTNVVTDYSGTSLASFDLDLNNLSATTINFVIEQDDLISSVLNFNALVRNLSGSALDRFIFSARGISFAAAGSVTPTFGNVGAISYNSSSAAIEFATPEFAEFSFGNPLGLVGQADWQLSLAGLSAGDSFSITAAVPEPGSIALMLAGLALLGAGARRSRGSRH